MPPTILTSLLLAGSSWITPLAVPDAACPTQEEGEKERKPLYDDTPLTKKQQVALLDTRVHPLITNNFNATCSLMFSFESVAIHTHSKGLSELPVFSPFPEGYKPTWRECFDTVARQVTCTWAYDPELTYWVFTPEEKEEAKLPFDWTMPDGWTTERVGNVQRLRSENKHALVQVHMLGSYSTDEDKPKKRRAFFASIRDQHATRIYQAMDEDYDVESDELVDLAGLDARYGEMLPNAEGYLLRQWTFMAEGYCWVISSTTTPQFDKVLSKEVEELLSGFEVTTPAHGWREDDAK